MGKKEYAVITFNPKHETFLIYKIFFSVTFFNSIPLNADIHPFCRSKIAGLIAKKTLTKVSTEYDDFTEVFSLDLAFKLLKQMRINNYAIELFNGHQPPYKLIYSLNLMDLETVKALLRLIWPTGLSDYPNYLQILLSFLTRSQMGSSSCALIIKTPITPQSRNSTCCP